MNHQMEGPLSEWGKRTRDLKQRCLEKLGRCRDQEGDIKIDPRYRSPKCRWQNEDGSIGCYDRDALEFDHIEGGGSAQRTAGTSGGDMTYREITQLSVPLPASLCQLPQDQIFKRTGRCATT